MNQRIYWSQIAERIALPVLRHLSARTLRCNMPVETTGNAAELRKSALLEALGRLLAGLAPWLELEEPATLPLASLAREAIDAITDPGSPDFGNFTEGGQPVVDTAFLAQGLLRAPKVLWGPLENRVKRNVLAALRASRVIRPYPCNWLLFSGMVETALYAFGAPDWDRMRIDYALRQHEQWYKGGGIYGDGAAFHADYYNSFVIQPMLIDIIRHVGGEEDWKALEPAIWTRAKRHAAILERLISPEGTYPPIGRSLSYRFGAMQGLAQMALLHALPEPLEPAQVREALSAVIRRSIEAPGTFDAEGWLRIGFCGHQPEVGESYINTGSLYLCSVGMLPLGLPATDPFWTAPALPWTSVRAWSGAPLPADHCIQT